MLEDRRSERDVTVGLIGLGYWGPNLLRVLSDIPGANVKWLCDVDSDRLARFHRRYPSAQITQRAEDVFEDPEIDAALIATPVFSHFDLASRSLQAGKHTFVEKPLAPSAEEADELAASALDSDLVLMCGHTFLYSPPVRAVKRLLDEGAIGDIFFVSSSRVNLGLHQPDVSVVWDLGPHDFSILRYWLGEMPENVRAIGRDSIVPGIADVAFVTLRYASGIVANVELSWLAPSKLRRTVVVGSEQMVVYEDGAREPLRIFDHGVVYENPEDFGAYQLSYRTGSIVSPKVESYEPLNAELTDFIRLVRGGAAHRHSTDLARDVVRLTEAADASLRDNGAEVTIDVESFNLGRSHG